MNNIKGAAVAGDKGGIGKTSVAHALALGAALHNVPAYLMHTDNRNPLNVQGRPYMYYDARKPETLQTLMSAALNQDGLCIIDSGGNRPEFDTWIAESVDLVLIPVIPDEEAVDLALKGMERLENAGAQNVRFIVNMYPSRQIEQRYVDREFFKKLPIEKVMGRIGEVRAIRMLRQSDNPSFQTPPSRVNNLARNLYKQVRDALENEDLRSDDIKMIA